MKATKIEEFSGLKLEPAFSNIECVNRIKMKHPEKSGKFDTTAAMNVALRDLFLAVID